jgi:RNA polymerase sigma factor (sigma-70 family)
LYKKWPEIKRFLKSFGCFSTDAEDIFQEALLIYTRKKQEPSFNLTVAPFHYVKSTCKLLWYNAARKQNNVHTVELTNQEVELEDSWFHQEMKLKKIEQAISQLGKQCKELLEMFYGLGLSMTTIAQKIGLRNEKVAKSQKYRCLQKAKELTQTAFSKQDEFSI